MFPTSNDPDLMVCITIGDGRELGGRELQKINFGILCVWKTQSWQKP